MYLVTINTEEQFIANPATFNLSPIENSDSELIGFNAGDDADYQITPFNHINDNSLSVLLTADNSMADLDNLPKSVQTVIFYVADFKDGRVFSLVRHLKKTFVGDIWIAGEFSLDQSGYFYKSGATGFIVQDNQLMTLNNTLADLKTAHFGQSVSSLPMFR